MLQCIIIQFDIPYNNDVEDSIMPNGCMVTEVCSASDLFSIM